MPAFRCRREARTLRRRFHLLCARVGAAEKRLLEELLVAPRIGHSRSPGDAALPAPQGSRRAGRGRPPFEVDAPSPERGLIPRTPLVKADRTRRARRPSHPRPPPARFGRAGSPARARPLASSSVVASSVPGHSGTPAALCALASTLSPIWAITWAGGPGKRGRCHEPPRGPDSRRKRTRDGRLAPGRHRRDHRRNVQVAVRCRRADADGTSARRTCAASSAVSRRRVPSIEFRAILESPPASRRGLRPGRG